MGNDRGGWYFWMYLCSCEDENLMKASIVVVVMLAISHFIPALAHFKLMQQFSQQSFTPVCVSLSLSPFFFPFVIIIKQATFCCDSHKFPHFRSFSRLYFLSYRKIHSLFFFSALTKIFHSRNWKELSAGAIQFDAKQSTS